MQVNISRLMLRLIDHVNLRTWDLGLPFLVRRGSRVALEEAQKSMGNRGSPERGPRERGGGAVKQQLLGLLVLRGAQENRSLVWLPR